MKFGWVAVIATVSAVVAAGLIVWVVIMPSATTSSTPGAINFSQVLPTGPVTSTNPQGCGANVTHVLLFPGGNDILRANATVNASGATVNYWLTGHEPYQHFVGTLVYSGDVKFGFDVSGATETFVFQGCAPFSGAPLGFWGQYGPVP